MANSTELLKQLLSKDALAGISKVTGVDGDEVTKILGAALPQLMSGAEKETAEKKDDFVVALADHAKKDTTNMSSFFNGVDLADGAKIIGHLLGNTDKTAEAVAKKAGVTKAKSKSVLSAVAPLFMSLLGKQSSASSSKPTSIFSTLTSALGIEGLDDVIGSILGDDKKKKQTAKKTDTATKKKTDTKKKTSTTAKKETAKKTDTKKKTTTTAAKKKTSTTAAKKETAKKTDTKKKASTTTAAKKKTTTTAKKKATTAADKKKTSTASTKKTDTKKKTATTAAKKTDTKKKTTTTAAKKKTSTTTAAKKKTSSKKSNEIDLGDVVTGLLGKIVK